MEAQGLKMVKFEEEIALLKIARVLRHWLVASCMSQAAGHQPAVEKGQMR